MATYQKGGSSYNNAGGNTNYKSNYNKTQGGGYNQGGSTGSYSQGG